MLQIKRGSQREYARELESWGTLKQQYENHSVKMVFVWCKSSIYIYKNYSEFSAPHIIIITILTQNTLIHALKKNMQLYIY